MSLHIEEPEKKTKSKKKTMKASAIKVIDLPTQLLNC